ncbi:Hypothetical predicted protein [Paramuricea clavata]|uniref:Uncharacterized protein n=1 Tax=Paramuricea clavata TaxID=317549 RepID=A0A7D9JDP8_PARCT|nr:Hypothetical predicted protein [Paramuricea clavata]
MAIIARFKANECVNRAFEHIYEGGPPLPPDEILSSHSVGGSADVAAIKCFSLCKNVGKCVGFNVKASLNDENCQFTNVTKSKNKNTPKKGEWKLFRDFEAFGIKYQYFKRYGSGRSTQFEVVLTECISSGKPNQIKLLQYDSLAQKLTAQSKISTASHFFREQYFANQSITFSSFEGNKNSSVGGIA